MNKQILATIILSAVLVTSGALISNVYANGFEKHIVDDCENIQIKQQATTNCTFHLTYSGDPAIILDSVPAEWRVIGFFDGEGNCDISDKKGKKMRGATKIVCDATSDDVDLVVHIATVRTPNDKWFKPTFCGELPLNDGAVALDPITFEVLDQTEPLTATTQDSTDEDDDGVVECLDGVIVDLCPERGLEETGSVDSDGCPNGGD